jgi:hypothetical protein
MMVQNYYARLDIQVYDQDMVMIMTEFLINNILKKHRIFKYTRMRYFDEN